MFQNSTEFQNQNQVNGSDRSITGIWVAVEIMEIKVIFLNLTYTEFHPAGRALDTDNIETACCARSKFKILLFIYTQWKLLKYSATALLKEFIKFVKISSIRRMHVITENS